MTITTLEAVKSCFLGVVESKDKLPVPQTGMIAFDKEHSIDGRTFLWIVEKGEWVLRESIFPVCPHCGK